MFSQIPPDERPRERLVAVGPDVLGDSELLAILIGRGVRGRSAVEIARELLACHGGWRGLLNAGVLDFCGCSGVGLSRYAVLQAALEMGRRYFSEPLKTGRPLTSPQLAVDFMRARLLHREHEAFVCLYLDVRHRVLGCDELFRGTVHGASVHPREIVKCALKLNACAVIVAHNHPSGVAEPSLADRQLTQRLCEALALVDIRLLDHLVVAERETVSFSERGLI